MKLGTDHYRAIVRAASSQGMGVTNVTSRQLGVPCAIVAELVGAGLMRRVGSETRAIDRDTVVCLTEGGLNRLRHALDAIGGSR